MSSARWLALLQRAGGRSCGIPQGSTPAVPAVGCTGGQHRSVCVAEALHQRFSTDWPSVKRHRDGVPHTGSTPSK